MTGHSEWTGKVGNVWAREWQRTDRSFAPVTRRLLDCAGLAPFSQVLDIGCGAGEISLGLSAASPSASVVGVDISEELLAVARNRAGGQPNVQFQHADAAKWLAPTGGSPDLMVSRHGVMFFDQPTAAFTHLAGQAASDTRLVFSCFRTRKENIWVHELASALPPAAEATCAPDPAAPGPFAFGNAERVKTILTAAGWRDVALEPIDYAMVVGEGDSAVADALSYFLRIGPAAGAVASFDPSGKDTAIARLSDVMDRHLTNGQVALPAACWIVTARAPG